MSRNRRVGLRVGSVIEELTGNLCAWYMWEGVSRWVLQLLLVGALIMKIVRRH